MGQQVQVIFNKLSVSATGMRRLNSGDRRIGSMHLHVDAGGACSAVWVVPSVDMVYVCDRCGMNC